MPRRTKDEAEKTRNSIMDAAEKVFFEHGVARTTLEQVAYAAKVTRGAVYWHFRDKIELLDAIMNRVFLPQEDILQNLAESRTESPLHDLRDACCDALVKMGKDKRRLRVVSIMLLRCEYTKEMEPLLKRRRTCKDRMLEQNIIMFERAKELEQLSPVWSPNMAAICLMAQMTGLIIAALEKRKSFDLMKTAPASLHAFFKSLEYRG